VRDDKLMNSAEVTEFLSGPVVIEEKIDGANLGISFDSVGNVRFQNRGSWLEGKLTGQWERLRAWGSKHEANLRDALPGGHVLFGEWCYARHSVHYRSLPDWFVAFDVYDTIEARFWSVSRRNKLVTSAGLSSVPIIATGTFSSEAVRSLLQTKSTYSDVALEGVYLRREDPDWLLTRAKVVRPDFTQSISEHWSKKSLVQNEIAGTPTT